VAALPDRQPLGRAYACEPNPDRSNLLFEFNGGGTGMLHIRQYGMNRPAHRPDGHYRLSEQGKAQRGLAVSTLQPGDLRTSRPDAALI
jgi:hypothetical protein